MIFIFNYPFDISYFSHLFSFLNSLEPPSLYIFKYYYCWDEREEGRGKVASGEDCWQRWRARGGAKGDGEGNRDREECVCYLYNDF